MDRDGFYCSSCLEKSRKYWKETRKWCIEHHICTECRKERVYGTDHTCPECRVKRDSWRKPLTEEQDRRYKQQRNTHAKELYEQRKSDGICTRCGKRKAIDGRTKCGICLDKDATKHRNARKINIKEYRKENHLCYYCGNPIDVNTGQVCSTCLERCKKNGNNSLNKNKYWKEDNNLIFRN